MRRILRFPLLAILLPALLIASCTSTPERPTGFNKPLDMQAMMGTWYVVARTPNLLERGHMASRNVYTLREDGKVAVQYMYRVGPNAPYRGVDAIAAPIAGSGDYQWRIRFYRLVPSTMRILELAPDDSWALIDSPGRDLAWVFSRKPDISTADYVQLRQRLRKHGVNVDKVWRVIQRADQVGKRGFDPPKEN